MLYLIRLLWLLSCLVYVVNGQAEAAAEFFGRHGSSHTNNWAVLVCASRYWFNYRVRGTLIDKESQG